MAERIQRKRTAGWRMPEGAVSCGRPGPWGNPINVSDVAGQYPSLDIEQIARLVVQQFDELVAAGSLTFPNWRHADGHRGPITFTYPAADQIRTELAGKDLACWCAPDQPCHVDVLLRVANEEA